MEENSIRNTASSDFRCSYCDSVFDSNEQLRVHKRRCPNKAFRIGPSFQTTLSKKLLTERRKLIGTYEWALTQSNQATPEKLKQVLKNKALTDLQKEILRLERQLVFHVSVADFSTELKRQIAYSHALHSVVNSRNKKRSKANKAQARKDAVKAMNQKTKPDLERSEDIMDQHFHSGSRMVVSGGLPSLGRKR